MIDPRTCRPPEPWSNLQERCDAIACGSEIVTLEGPSSHPYHTASYHLSFRSVPHRRPRLVGIDAQPCADNENRAVERHGAEPGLWFSGAPRTLSSARTLAELGGISRCFSAREQSATSRSGRALQRRCRLAPYHPRRLSVESRWVGPSYHSMSL